MESVSYHKYLKISPRKIKNISSIVCGLKPKSALERLMFLPNKSAKILAKSLKSALANATNNLKIDADKWKVKNIEILKGPFLKRYQPVSRGMAHQIKKRTAHIRIILESTQEKKVINKLPEKTAEKTPDKTSETTVLPEKK